MVDVVVVILQDMMRTVSRDSCLLSYQQKLLDLISVKPVGTERFESTDVLLYRRRRFGHDCGIVKWCWSRDVAGAGVKHFDG
jgi:hypothetical protein